MPEEKTTTVAEPSLEELLTTLKATHNIDVSALQAQTAETAQQAKLSQTIVEALTTAGIVQLSATDNKTPDNEVVTKAVQELATNNVTLTNRLTTLERREAEHEVDKYISAGRILPAEKDARIELKLTNPEMFEKLLPANAIVTLSNEVGVNAPNAKEHELDVAAEIARLTAAFSK